MKTIIVTDSTCDLPLSYIEDNQIELLGLTVSIQGKETIDDLGKTVPYKDFYDLLRDGEKATTSQVNTHRFTKVFLDHAKAGHAIIYIGFSSALSGTYNSACFAREEVLEQYPDADITVIDTLAASCGEGLLVYYACEMLKNGKSKDEIVQWIEDHKLKVVQLFTVADIDHLKRGGRISGTTTAVRSTLSVKPILYVNDQGQLIPYDKARGLKKAIRALVGKLKEHIKNPQDQTIFISHGDCLEDATDLADTIRKEISVKDIVISTIGTTVGSHTGPGTLALFFLGETRTP